MIDANTSYEEISDAELIAEFISPKKYKRALLYALMAKRSNHNERIKELLFKVILDEGKRKERFLNTLPHSWIPTLYILEHGNDLLKNELLGKLKEWTNDEKELFLNYVKKDKEYLEFLQPLKD